MGNLLTKSNIEGEGKPQDMAEEPNHTISNDDAKDLEENKNQQISNGNNKENGTNKDACEVEENAQSELDTTNGTDNSLIDHNTSSTSTSSRKRNPMHWLRKKISIKRDNLNTSASGDIAKGECVESSPVSDTAAISTNQESKILKCVDEKINVSTDSPAVDTETAAIVESSLEKRTSSALVPPNTDTSTNQTNDTAAVEAMINIFASGLDLDKSTVDESIPNEINLNDDIANCKDSSPHVTTDHNNIKINGYLASHVSDSLHNTNHINGNGFTKENDAHDSITIKKCRNDSHELLNHEMPLAVVE